jgi:hypothetical protein
VTDDFVTAAVFREGVKLRMAGTITADQNAPFELTLDGVAIR